LSSYDVLRITPRTVGVCSRSRDKEVVLAVAAYAPVVRQQVLDFDLVPFVMWRRGPYNVICFPLPKIRRRFGV